MRRPLRRPLRRLLPRPPGAVVGLTIGAIALRLLLFTGRGDYVAFDEGWYLLLGRSLWTGHGYQLIGVPHITLSPLFPFLAGGVGRVLGDWVWGGRVVAAVASGLLVLPVWALARRFTGTRPAMLAACLVAVLPSMAPFVAAYWVGADLWVGAEPLAHLAVYTALAIWCHALDDGRASRWMLAGGCFGLGFLARPEVIGVLGLLAAWTLAWSLPRRHPATARGATIAVAAFALVVSPYWFRIHALTGDWRLTGRELDSRSALRMIARDSTSAAGDIERMLAMDDGAYEARLYSLAPDGLRMGSAYWGVSPTPLPAASVDVSAPPVTAPADARPPRRVDAPADTRRPVPAPTTLQLLRIAAATILPIWCWVFVPFGLLGLRRVGREAPEWGVTIALLGTSVVIGAAVAIDARTQLLVVPLLAIWAARGVGDVAAWSEARGRGLRPDFVRRLLVGVVVGASLVTHAWRLGLSWMVGSPHHEVGRQNRLVARQLDALLEGRPGPIASWHPAIALFADRAWRPVPLTDLPRIVRYEQAAGAVGLVLSSYYPPIRGQEVFGARYAVMPIPAGVPALVPWRLVPAGGNAFVVRVRAERVRDVGPPPGASRVR